MTDEHCREILNRNCLPEPPAGELVDVCYVMGYESWYVETSEGKFYWLDLRERTWKLCPQGPLHP